MVFEETKAISLFKFNGWNIFKKMNKLKDIIIP